jgi:hypothetical protein
MCRYFHKYTGYALLGQREVHITKQFYFHSVMYRTLCGNIMKQMHRNTLLQTDVL